MRLTTLILVTALCALSAPALAKVETYDHDIRFCPSWAEAHERTLASLNNNGRKPPRVHWKGCIWVEKGTQVEVFDHDEWSTEIVIKGIHWFTDE